ncbi:MAG: lytic transglycosylase domain-containing protein [Phenylobacterium sp.]|uniref:lytic transglycosylase domain-containing protein n=1 Tax=Phenylobacterium sp. TaxID=1871053 RepID=UPI002733CC7B|nr:lytic transglycosylase domain-containing protein [Phenylobacterium sp.]MDP3749292.1 lytic transglycosylase domain-containing protein [Phenylobacterium sp.]
MILELAAALALSERCAPKIAPGTLIPIVRTESGFDTLAIGVNRGATGWARPRTPQAAAQIARKLIADGANLDLGLAQINTANLARLRLSVEDAFDPCRNLAAAGELLAANYHAVRGRAPNDQAALRTALSLYNTGRTDRGFRNGYVAKVEAAARSLVPAIDMAPETKAPTAGDTGPASRDVFARASSSPILVFAAGAPSTQSSLEVAP